MSEWSTLKFKVYCIEEFRQKHGLTAPETVDLFEKYGVFRFLELPAMQWQSLDNSVLDIEEFIEARSRKEPIRGERHPAPPRTSRTGTPSRCPHSS